MNRAWAFVLMVPLGFAAAGELVVSIPLDPSALEINGPSYCSAVTAPGMNVTGNVGAPELPAYTERIALPPGCSATTIEVLEQNYQPVRGIYEIMPHQHPVPLSLMGSAGPPAEPDPEIYYSDDFYPSVPVEFRGSSVIMGFPVAYVRIFPARWNPSGGTLEYLTGLTVRVEYCPSSDASTVSSRSAASEERSRRVVMSTVANPEDVTSSGAVIVASRDLSYGEYVIIATPQYESYAQELADWKTSKGVPASVYTTDWIDANYGFYDLQQDIRAFLTDCRDEGVEFVLIYGDDDVIPGRDAEISDGSSEDYPPVDLYWSDINDMVPGADLWDSDYDHTWGEFEEDEIDYHPDLWVGRASVNTTGECDIFNRKVYVYEGIGTLDYFEESPIELRIGYTTEMLWPGCYGSAGAELISQYVPDDWEEEKCYDYTGDNSVAHTDSMINAGPHQIYHASHGSQTAFSLPGGAYTTYSFKALENISNGGLPAIWNSISCLIGALDYSEDCMGDAWLNSPGGGGFGAFNARYGWGNPGNPGYGASEILCRYFYDVMWNDDLFMLGVAHAMGSDEMSPPGSYLDDWCVKEYNLFGDPELPMWFADAEQLDADHVTSIDQASTLDITITSSGSPVQGARVCLQKGDWKTGDVYQIENTDASGHCSFYVNPVSTGEISVVAWARDHVSYVGSIQVTGTGMEGGVSSAPSNFIMSPRPSPATSSVEIPFSLEADGHASLDVYDMTGRLVTTAAAGQMARGSHTAVWELDDGNGGQVPSGMYSIRLTTTSGWTGTARVLVLR